MHIDLIRDLAFAVTDAVQARRFASIKYSAGDPPRHFERLAGNQDITLHSFPQKLNEENVQVAVLICGVMAAIYFGKRYAYTMPVDEKFWTFLAGRTMPSDGVAPPVGPGYQVGDMITPTPGSHFFGIDVPNEPQQTLRVTITRGR